MPLMADYSFATVKDSAFSLFATALIPVLLAVRAGAGRLLSARRGTAVVVVVLAGFALMRSNALPVVLVILALMVWWSRARLRRALAVSAVVLIVVVTPSALTARSQHVEEAVGIPLQTVGYPLTHDADCLPPASRQVFDNVLAPETWKQAYRPSSVDPVKDSPAFNGAYLDAHRGQFLSAWGRALVACPRPFVTGFLVHTANLWRFDADPVGTDGQSRFISVVSNHPADRDELIRTYARAGVVNRSLLPGPVRPVAGAAVRAMEATPGPGTWMWVAALSVVGFIYAGRHEWVAIYAPVILVWATLMVAAPTVTPFRYMAPLIMAVPIGLAVLLGTDRTAWEPTPIGEVQRPHDMVSRAVHQRESVRRAQTGRGLLTRPYHLSETATASVAGGDAPQGGASLGVDELEPLGGDLSQARVPAQGGGAGDRARGRRIRAAVEVAHAQLVEECAGLGALLPQGGPG